MLTLRTLGLLALAASAHATSPLLASRACSKTVAAKSGDTCATIASAAGITVAQFLQANPSITSCSQLTPGVKYCIDGTGSGVSSSVPAGPTQTASVSTDGTCGPAAAGGGGGVTCSGSKFGTCCSQHGYCGSTGDYCGSGCLAGFGDCGDGSGSTSQVPTTTPVGTVYVTSTVFTTVTSTNVVKTTSTVIVTGGVTRTTVVVTSTSVATVTNVINVTRLTTETITSITTLTLTKPAACGPTTTPTTTQPGKPPSTSIIPGTPATCKAYDEIEATDNCLTIARRNNITLRDFEKINPSVSSNPLNPLACDPSLIELLLSGLCQVDCDNLWVGWYVCVG